jgi:hypothetical protein
VYRAKEANMAAPVNIRKNEKVMLLKSIYRASALALLSV